MADRADLAGVGLQVADQHAQQRRLAGPVRPQYADPVAAKYAGAETLDDRAAAILLGDIAGLDRHAAPDLAFLKHDAGALRRAEHGGAALAHVRQRGEAALVAPAAGGDAAMQPARLLGDPPVELLLPPQFLGDHRFRPFLESGEAARGLAQPAPLQPEDAVGDVREEAPVVADGDDRTFIAANEAFQPLDGGQVEMVGRLVKQQDIGRHGQYARQLCPPALAAGKRRHAPVRVEFQLVQHRRGGMVGGGRPLIRGAADIVADKRPGVDRRVLVQIGDADAGLGVAFAEIELQLACDDLHQGGLAAAVAADQAGAVAARNAEADVGKQACTAETDFGVAEREDRRAGHRRPSGAQLCRGDGRFPARRAGPLRHGAPRQGRLHRRKRRLPAQWRAARARR